MEREKANHAVSRLCQLFGVSRSGFYAWQKRPLSARARTDEELLSTITMIHRESRGNYGAPRVQVELRHKYHVRSSRRRVARLMHQAGLVGVRRGKKKSLTKSDPGRTVSPDLVKRDFTASTSDNVWAAYLSASRAKNSAESEPTI